MADGFALCRLKRLFGGNPVEPALLRQLFVVGEAQSNQDAHMRFLGRRRFRLRPQAISSWRSFSGRTRTCVLWTRRSSLGRISTRRRSPRPLPLRRPCARTSGQLCLRAESPASSLRICGAPVALPLRSCRNRKPERFVPSVIYNGPKRECQATTCPGLVHFKIHHDARSE